MKIVPGHTRLYRRWAVYYHRAVVPVDIRETYGKREELISLKTRDYREAVKKLRRVAVEVDVRFDAHRKRKEKAFEVSALSQEAINRLAELRFQQVVRGHEKARLKLMASVLKVSPDDPAPSPPPESDDEASNILAAWRYKKELDAHRQRDLARRTAVMDGWKAEVEEAFAEFKEAYTGLRWEAYAIHADTLLAEENIKLSGEPANYPEFVLALLAAEMRGIEVCLKKYEGEGGPEVREEAEVQEDIQKAIGAKDGPLFSEESTRWVEDQIAGGRWKPKTARAIKSALKRFEEYAGDRGIGAYSKADARGFKELLLKLPVTASLAQMSL